MIQTNLTCPAIRLVPPAPPKPLEFLFRNGCQGDKSRPGGHLIDWQDKFKIGGLVVCLIVIDCVG